MQKSKKYLYEAIGYKHFLNIEMQKGSIWGGNEVLLFSISAGICFLKIEAILNNCLNLEQKSYILFIKCCLWC